MKKCLILSIIGLCTVFSAFSEPKFTFKDLCIIYSPSNTKIFLLQSIDKVKKVFGEPNESFKDGETTVYKYKNLSLYTKTGQGTIQSMLVEWIPSPEGYYPDEGHAEGSGHYDDNGDWIEPEPQRPPEVYPDDIYKTSLGIYLGCTRDDVRAAYGTKGGESGPNSSLYLINVPDAFIISFNYNEYDQVSSFQVSVGQ
jgi:hypothetical protein